ncbi:aldo/keto reductase [Brachybacterium sp. EF45031]|uniref:aldo/keto reductase n=1 Tax=Brachybacterium sillae TaxID=2810536 RepID=UPI00217D8B32|nr:aldo/keto reductase [Brachybacterium sillae]MCS6711936.1 aldo/keto reductase [Brachybacterium sillae]
MPVASIPLADGRTIPQLGFGVFKVPPGQTEEVTAQALLAGYRHVDTAARYENEAGVGAAVRASGLEREDLFITTKLQPDDMARTQVPRAFARSLEELGLEYVDLFLVHWATPSQGRYVEAWEALIELQEQGRVRSIGVCNHPRPQLEEIVEATGVVPVIHQIELHPYFQQHDLRALHAELGIVTESWGPLGQGKQGLLEDDTLVRIAREHDATSAQVVLAWHLAEGLVALPKSVTPSRIVENLAATELELTEQDLAAIRALDRPDGRGGADPAER